MIISTPCFGLFRPNVGLMMSGNSASMLRYLSGDVVKTLTRLEISLPANLSDATKFVSAETNLFRRTSTIMSLSNIKSAPSNAYVTSAHMNDHLNFCPPSSRLISRFPNVLIIDIFAATRCGIAAPVFFRALSAKVAGTTESAAPVSTKYFSFVAESQIKNKASFVGTSTDAIVEAPERFLAQV